MTRHLRSALLFFVALLASVPVLGQNFEKEPFQNLTGTIKGVAPTAVQVAVTEKEVWRITIDETQIKPQDIVFSGVAEKSFLRSGMFVEFRASVSKRGTVMEPVANLTVFTPSDVRPPALDPDGVGGGGGNALFNDPKEDKKPGAKEDKKPDPKEKKAARAKADDTVYRVAGAITKIGRAGDVTVSADGTQVKFNLAEECKIAVELNDLTFVSAGDKAVVQGWSYKGMPGEGVASKIEVTAVNPLTDGKKKPVKPVKETKPTTKGTKGKKPEPTEKGDKEEKPGEEKKEEAKKDGAKKDEAKKDGDKGAEKADAKKDG